MSVSCEAAFLLALRSFFGKVSPPTAEVAELADALDSGSSVRKDVQVQILSSAPTTYPGRPFDPTRPRGLTVAPISLTLR